MIGVVREAWESALDLERAQFDPPTGQWEEVAPEYQRLWEATKPAIGAIWADVEPGYRYAVEMGVAPRFHGRPWGEAAPHLEAGLPRWAVSHGYHVREGESLWERLRESIRHVWERAQARRDRHASSR